MRKEFREYLIGLLGAIILTLILNAPLLKALIINPLSIYLEPY